MREGYSRPLDDIYARHGSHGTNYGEELPGEHCQGVGSGVLDGAEQRGVEC